MDEKENVIKRPFVLPARTAVSGAMAAVFGVTAVPEVMHLTGCPPSVYCRVAYHTENEPAPSPSRLFEIATTVSSTAGPIGGAVPFKA